MHRGRRWTVSALGNLVSPETRGADVLRRLGQGQLRGPQRHPRGVRQLPVPHGDARPSRGLVIPRLRPCHGGGEGSPAQRDRLRSFLVAHFGWSEAKAHYLPATVSLPLRPFRSLRWMGRLDSLLWVLGTVAAVGLLATLAISQQPVKPFRLENVLFLSPFWAAGATFVPLLVLYRVLRKPSLKQAHIRRIIASQLEASSDPADWPPEVAVPVAAAYGAKGCPGRPPRRRRTSTVPRGRCDGIDADEAGPCRIRGNGRRAGPGRRELNGRVPATTARRPELTAHRTRFAEAVPTRAQRPQRA